MERTLSENRRYRKFSAQQKTELVLASLRGPKTIAELCREHDISDSLLRKWREQFLDLLGSVYLDELVIDNFHGVARWSSGLAAAGSRSGGACGLRDSLAGRGSACGCSVGACGTQRKPLALLGLGLTAALRVRSVRVGAAGRRLVSPTTRPEQGRRRTR